MLLHAAKKKSLIQLGTNYSRPRQKRLNSTMLAASDTSIQSLIVNNNHGYDDEEAKLSLKSL